MRKRHLHPITSPAKALSFAPPTDFLGWLAQALGLKQF